MRHLLALAAASALAAPASAGTLCLTTPDLRALLTDRYGEVMQGAGLDGNGLVVEVWTHPEGRSFSIILTAPDGHSCVLRDGELWMAIEPRPPGTDG
jgi:hypothetical protein